MAQRWMLYGATGYTGRLIAAEATRRGMPPLLAGRDGSSLAELAEELGCAAEVVGLDEKDRLHEIVGTCDAVLHCAGPFVHTSRPVLDACLAAGVPYLDITGEIAVFEEIFARRGEVERGGIPVVPGVGFDVVATDCLARRLSEALPDATHLELAFASSRGEWSRGTLKTVVESLPAVGAERRDGRIVRLPPAHYRLTLELVGLGRRHMVSIPWGDVSTAYHTTGIPNIRVYGAMPPRMAARLHAMRALLPVLAVRPVRRLLQWWIGRVVTGPDSEARATGRTAVWGRVSNAGGETLTGTLEINEGYRFTVDAALTCLARLAAAPPPPGVWTPSRAFGADLVDAVPGTVRGELMSLGSRPEGAEPRGAG